jgi:hypothetical protein
MSNSYTSPPTLVDPGRVTASLTLRATEMSRLGDLQNYIFATGGTSDVLNQYWDLDVFEANDTSDTTVCEWYIPRPSNIHNELKVRVGAHQTHGGVATVVLTFPTSANTYSQSTTITDSSRFQSAFNEVSINVTGNETDERIKLSLQLRSTAPGYVQMAFIEARWTPLSSPLTTGALTQGADSFIPQGVSRLGADPPLTARFGVETLENLTMLRKRGRTLYQWSGARTSRAGSDPAQGVGIFDPQVMFSNVALYGGMNQIDGLEVDVFIDVVNYSVGSFIDIFGQRLSITSNGWNQYSLKLRLEEVTLSDEFRLSMYQVGIDDTLNNSNLLLSINNKINTSPLYIRAISIIGV